MKARPHLSFFVLSATLTVYSACADDGPHPLVSPTDANGDKAVASDAGPLAMERAAPSSYVAVVEILERSCAFIRCHAGTPVGGALSLARGTDHAQALVGVTACEYERMQRVEPYHPERSWLMVKLTAQFRPNGDPYAGYIRFEPDVDWDPEQRGCRDQTEDGSALFGQRMPLTAPNALPEADLAVLRDWIASGAPHRPALSQR